MKKRPTDDETLNFFKKQWVPMKKQALEFAKNYFDDENILSVKLKLEGWIVKEDDESEPEFNQGKPSKEDLINWGEMDIMFTIILKMDDSEKWEPKNIVIEDGYSLYAFFYDDGFHKVDNKFYLEIR